MDILVEFLRLSFPKSAKRITIPSFLPKPLRKDKLKGNRVVDRISRRIISKGISSKIVHYTMFHGVSLDSGSWDFQILVSVHM